MILIEKPEGEPLRIIERENGWFEIYNEIDDETLESLINCINENQFYSKELLVSE